MIRQSSSSSFSSSSTLSSDFEEMEIHSGDEPSSMNDSSDINGESMGCMGGDNIGGESGNVDAY